MGVPGQEDPRQDPPDTGVGICIAMQDPQDTQEDLRQDPPDTGVCMYSYAGSSGHRCRCMYSYAGFSGHTGGSCLRTQVYIYIWTQVYI